MHYSALYLRSIDFSYFGEKFGDQRQSYSTVRFAWQGWELLRTSPKRLPWRLQHLISFIYDLLLSWLLMLWKQSKPLLPLLFRHQNVPALGPSLTCSPKMLEARSGLLDFLRWVIGLEDTAYPGWVPGEADSEMKLGVQKFIGGLYLWKQRVRSRAAQWERLGHDADKASASPMENPRAKIAHCRSPVLGGNGQTLYYRLAQSLPGGHPKKSTASARKWRQTLRTLPYSMKLGWEFFLNERYLSGASLGLPHWFSQRKDYIMWKF